MTAADGVKMEAPSWEGGHLGIADVQDKQQVSFGKICSYKSSWNYFCGLQLGKDCYLENDIYLFIYLAGCTVFPHIPVPVWQLYEGCFFSTFDGL